jgi:Domain of unknown function (DUF4157)
VEEEEEVQTNPLSEYSSPLIQRQPKEEEEEVLQTNATSMENAEGAVDFESRIQSLRGGGQPLPESARNFFEPRFGNDFGQVSVHTDSHAGELVRSVNARAFTVGRDIVFGAGQYAPETESGKSLLAHELTHVVQQGGGTETNRVPDSMRDSRPTDAFLSGDLHGAITPSTRDGAIKATIGSLYKRNRIYFEVQRQQMATVPAPQTPTYQILHGPDFHESLDGVTLNATLVSNVNSLCQHLIQNNLVNGNIVFGQGVRSPVVAHRWSTAWSVRNDAVPLANLEALTDGNDLDGNHWYTPGWTMDQAKQNAATIWSGAQAAEGYREGNPRKAPNTYPNVSNHCAGTAMDVTIPWASGNGTDETANTLVARFNLTRPVPGERWHFEL